MALDPLCRFPIPFGVRLEKEYPEVAASLNAAANGAAMPNLMTEISTQECAYSCDTGYSPSGLLVNMKYFWSCGRKYVDLDSRRTSCDLYLRIRRLLLRREPPVKPAASPGLSSVEQSSVLMTPSIVAQTEELYDLYIPSVGALIPLVGTSPDKRLQLNATHWGFSGSVKDDKQEDSEILPSTATHGDVESVSAPVDSVALRNLFQETVGMPPHLLKIIKEIVSRSTPDRIDPGAAWKEEVFESTFAAHLVQVEDPPQIPPSGWKCARCGKTKNLWLNLHDGYIGCGRKIYDMPDTGCLDCTEGAALLHYNEDPERRPLVVKLGSISPASADIYSYAEECMVSDPLLAQHLLHFGINISQAEATEKSTAELQLQYNLNYDWSRVHESSRTLIPCEGPGLIGLKNFGNTCYMNAPLQLLVKLPPLVAVCGEPLWKARIAQLLPMEPPTRDFLLQFSKTIIGLSSNEYVQQRLEVVSNPLLYNCAEDERLIQQEWPNAFISPALFRSLVTGKHPEFASSRQQDSDEFIRFLLDALETLLSQNLMDRKGLVKCLLGFEVTERFKALDGSGRVKLKSVKEQILSLPLPVKLHRQLSNPPNPSVDLPQESPAGCSNEAETLSRHNSREGPCVSGGLGSATADNCSLPIHQDKSSTDLAANADLSIGDPQSSLQACFDQWAAGEQIAFSEASRQLNMQLQRGFHTFPAFLLIHLGRFYIAPDWTAKKIVAKIQMPDMIDLGKYRLDAHSSIDPGTEIAWPEITEEQREANGSSSAYQIVEGVEASSTLGGSTVQGVSPPPLSEEGELLLSRIESMGFEPSLARRALSVMGCNRTLDFYIDWILSHDSDPTTSISSEPQTTAFTLDAKTAINGPLSTDKSGLQCSSSIDQASNTNVEHDQSSTDELTKKMSSPLLAEMGFPLLAIQAAMISNGFDESSATNWLVNMESLEDRTGEFHHIVNSFRVSEASRTDAIGTFSTAMENLPSANTTESCYRLVGFVSHTGSGPNSGHYICHCWDTSRQKWILYNDLKVGESLEPATGDGYVYLYARMKASETVRSNDTLIASQGGH